MNDTELSPEFCAYLNEVAERDGLCPNCFHTRECCNDTCWALNNEDLDEHAHTCPGTPDPRPVGWGW